MEKTCSIHHNGWEAEIFEFAVNEGDKKEYYFRLYEHGELKTPLVYCGCEPTSTNAVFGAHVRQFISIAKRRNYLE